MNINKNSAYLDLKNIIVANFAIKTDYPLVKTKFGVFNSGIVRLKHYKRDVHLFREVNPESLRIDLGWGAPWIGWPKQPIYGSIENIEYDFTEMDGIARILNKANVLPYWCYCYMPEPLQTPFGEWKSPPSDLSKWGEVLAAVAGHYRDSDPPNPVGYHEIYNEPDGNTFFTGTIDDYLGMYENAAQRIKAVDPEALIGGPALESKEEWISPFLDYVSKHRLPLDFFSFHFYGTSSDKRSIFQDLPEWLQIIRNSFAARPEFVKTEFHLNEFNSYPVDYPIDGPQQKYPLASALLRDFKYLLSQPDVTLVHWAQFMDSGPDNFSGMISIDGHRKAVFNAYKIYAMMPVDRRQVTIIGPEGLDGMASTDMHKSSLVIWNETGKVQPIEVSLVNIPFTQGTLKVYRIDADHASWGDNPSSEELLPVESHAGVNTVNLAWSGSIPNGGVVYLEIEDGTGLSELTPNPVARVVRVLHYYPDRTKTSYADFDKNTWIARLGMVREQEADLKVGVTAEQLPNRLNVFFEVDGTLQKLDSNSLLGLRIDYMVEGSYTWGVLFHGPYKGSVDLYDPANSATMPWGTERKADRVIKVLDLSSFQVNVAALAPENWSGRAQITFLMQNSGVGTRAKVVIRRV